MQTERHDKANSRLPHFRIRLRTIRLSGLHLTASFQSHTIGSIISSKTVMYRQMHRNHKQFIPSTLTSTCVSVRIRSNLKKIIPLSTIFCILVLSIILKQE
jgi:hypothetical protein